MNKYILLTILISISSLRLVGQNVEVMTNTGHSKGKLHVSTNSSNTLLATSGGDLQIKIWELNSGRELKTFIRDVDIRDIHFLPGKNQLVVLEEKLYQFNRITVLDIKSGNTINQFNISNAGLIEVSDDGNYLATFKYDNAKIWNLATGKLLYKSEKKPDYLTFDSSGEKIIFEDKKQAKVFFIDWKTNTTLWSKTFTTAIPGAATFTKKGDRVIVLTSNSMAYILDAINGSELKTIKIPEIFGNHFVDVSQDDNFFVARGNNNLVKYSLINYHQSGKVYLSPENEKRKLQYAVSDVEVLANGSALVAYDLAVDLCDFSDKVNLSYKGGLTKYSEISFSNDNRFALGKYSDGRKLREFSLDLYTGKRIEQSLFTPDYEGFVTFLNDSDYYSVFTKTSLKLYTYPENKNISKLSYEGYSNTRYSLIGGDNRWVVNLSARKKGTEVVDISANKFLATFPTVGGGINSKISFSIDNNYFVLASPQAPSKLYCMDIGQKTVLWEKETQASRVAQYSPNGQFILAGGGNDGVGELNLYNSKTGDLINTFKGHEMPIEAVAFNHNGKQVLSGSGWFLASSKDNSVRLWDVESGEQLQIMKSHLSAVKDVAISMDNNQIISSSDDNSIKIWDANNGELLVTLYGLIDANEWAMITPDNYYFASKGGTSVVHFVVNNKAYSFDQFDLLFNRPDIVLQRLGRAPKEIIAAYKAAYIKRLRKMGFDQVRIDQFVSGSFNKNIQTPEVIIPDEIRNLGIIESKMLSFEAKASDPGGVSIERIHLVVNGVPIYGAKGKFVKEPKSRIIIPIKNLELSNGFNTIELSVQNANGILSLAEKVNLKYIGQPSVTNTYIVSIGISDYQNNNYDLNYAAKDANDIAAKFGTNASKVFKITDGNAVKEKVLAIKSELLKSKVDDRVILFVAGHGLLDDNLDYFIGMHDVDFENPPARGLPYEELEGLLDGIPARKKLMFIDACHSGEVDKDDAVIAGSTSPKFQTLAKLDAGTTIASRGFKTIASKSEGLGLQNSFELMQQLFADLRKGTGAVVISSASGAEFALESDAWKNGVFTYSVLEGLENRKCDANKDGAVQVSELKNYVFDRVSALTNGKQHPTSRRENLEFDFVVW